VEAAILRDYSTPTEELLPQLLSSGIGPKSVRFAGLRVNSFVQNRPDTIERQAAHEPERDCGGRHPA
jgi:hypothetical protein